MLPLPLLQFLDPAPKGDDGPIKFAVVEGRNLPQALFLPLLLGLLPPIQALCVSLLDDGGLGETLRLCHRGLLHRL